MNWNTLYNLKNTEEVFLWKFRKNVMESHKKYKYLKTDSLSQNYGLWLKISQSATSSPIKAPFIVIMVDY